MGETHFEIDTLKINPLNAIKTLFNKVENELSGGELSEIGLILVRALKRIEEKK